MTNESKATTRDLYEDPSIADNKVLKPLTGVPNEYAPQEGVHLYHFCGSYYSHEARLLLEEKGVEYVGHDICIIGGCYDQYNPDYVRINPRCVVPTLVVGGKVTTDSHNMLMYAEDIQLGGPEAPKLIPADPKEKQAVQEWFELATSIFIEPLTYGEVPGGPKLPWYMSTMMKGNHEKKAKALKEHIEKFKDDAYLKSAYESKLTIMTKMMGVLDSDENLEEIVQLTQGIMRKLNTQLVEGPAKDGTSWLCGKDYSMADMQWALALYRLQLRGYTDFFWADYPAIQAYAERLIARPAFQKAVVAWQGTSNIFSLVVRRKISQLFGFGE
jgi:glutathione S-transferase